jgi:hypothetical protein
MTTMADAASLATLATEFPGWHVWRSRDSRGRDDGWCATRRRKPRRVPSDGTLGRVSASSHLELRALLAQRHAVSAVAGQAA